MSGGFDLSLEFQLRPSEPSGCPDIPCPLLEHQRCFRNNHTCSLVDKTAEEFKAPGEITGGDIHIGCAESDGIKYLARRIKAVQEQYPGIRVHLYSGDTNDLSERLDRGLLDFAVIAQAVDLSKYNYLELPGTDVWGVVMRKDTPLAQREAVRIDDLLDLPLIVSRQDLQEDIPKLLGETVDRLHITATLNLAYNGSVMPDGTLGSNLAGRLTCNDYPSRSRYSASVCGFLPSRLASTTSLPRKSASL